MADDDFASLFGASMAGAKPRTRRLKNGEVVEGSVLQIGADSVFLDVGAATDARVPRAELENADGKLRVKVGDQVRATVVDAEAEPPLLATSLGKSNLDIGQLESALESGTAVTGRVTRAVKGGLEIEIGGVRAFCPASQVEIGFAQDLATYEGQSFEFKVLEIKDSGRSVVVSRRALLESERREREAAMRDHLVPGTDLEGTISSLGRHGAIVDLGGVDGFVHLSELSHRRVEKPEDVVNVGDRVLVRVISVEESDRGLRVRLSMKARAEPVQTAPPAVDEILDGVVVRAAGGGVIVQTSKGEGMVPLAELGLPPGADHRRAFPAGKNMKVVAIEGRGRLRFSAVGVARVEERKNFQEFSEGASPATPGSALGSLGDVFRKKLGMPDAPASAPAEAPQPAAAPIRAAAPARDRESDKPVIQETQRQESRSDPPGVVRRRKT